MAVRVYASPASVPERRAHWLVLIVLLGLCFGASWLGGMATESGLPWYTTLAKPVWTPPSEVFTPIWLLLYALMAVAGWLVWKRVGGTAAGRGPIALFLLQLLLNVGWSFAFFGSQSTALGLGVIALLWVAIALTAWVFYGVDQMAGFLMMPYLLWVTFAFALNFAIWRMNGVG